MHVFTPLPVFIVTGGMQTGSRAVFVPNQNEYWDNSTFDGYEFRRRVSRLLSVPWISTSSDVCLIYVIDGTFVRAEKTAGLDNNELDFYTSNIERMIVKDTGKVGINVSETTRQYL